MYEALQSGSVKIVNWLSDKIQHKKVNIYYFEPDIDILNWMIKNNYLSDSVAFGNKITNLNTLKILEQYNVKKN